MPMLMPSLSSGGKKYLTEKMTEYNNLLNLLPILIWQTDNAGRLKFVNDAWAQFTGSKREDILEKVVSDYISKEDLKKILLAFETYTSGDKTFSLEYSLRRNDGVFRHILDFVQPMVDDEGGGHGFIGTGMDVTDQIITQAALIEGESRYRSLYENIPIGVYRLSPEGKILMMNPFLIRMLGYKAEDELLIQYAKTENEDEPGSIEDFIHLLDEAGEIQSYETVLMDRNGKPIYVRQNARTIRGPHGEMIYIEGVIENRTAQRIFEEQRKTFERELLAQNEALKDSIRKIQNMQLHLIQSDKLASIGQLSAGIAHEINNPLSYLTSNLNRLGEYFHDLLEILQSWQELGAHVKDTQEGNNCFQHIRELEQSLDIQFIINDAEILLKNSQEGVIRIRDIVEKIRGFSRMGNDAAGEVDMNRLLEEVLILLKNELKYKVQIEKRYEQIPCIWGNSGEIQHVFINLILNAMHAIPDKGTITIRTSSDERFVYTEITDTGCGIPDEHLHKIFDPFFTTRPVGKGTGLGLWISMNIIQKHKGTIDVQSVLGKGSIFKVTLPIKNDKLKK